MLVIFYILFTIKLCAPIKIFKVMLYFISFEFIFLSFDVQFSTD